MKMNYGSLKKWLIPKLGQRKYKVSLKQFMAESKEVLRNDGDMPERHRVDLKGLPLTKMAII